MVRLFHVMQRVVLLNFTLKEMNVVSCDHDIVSTLFILDTQFYCLGEANNKDTVENNIIINTKLLLFYQGLR